MNNAPSWTTKGSDDEDSEARAPARAVDNGPNARPHENAAERAAGAIRGRREYGEEDDAVRLRAAVRRLAETAERASQSRASWERPYRESGRDGVEESLDDLIGRLGRVEPPLGESRGAGVQRALDSLERQLFDIAAQFDRDGRSSHYERDAQRRRALNAHDEFDQSGSAEREGVERRLDELRRAIDSISTQIEAIRSGAAERDDQRRFVTGEVGRLRDEIANLSGALGDLAPRSSIAAVETALRTLADRIETQRSRGVQDGALAPVERLAADMRAFVKELDPGPAISGLLAQAQAIGERLDELKTLSGSDSATIEELTKQTGEMRGLLSSIASRLSPLEKLETQLAELARRVDALGASNRDAGQRDMAEIVKNVRSAVATEASGALRTFGQRLDEQGTKLDALLSKSGNSKRFDELGHRIDEVQKSLAARIDRNAAFQRPADTSQLEHLLSKLAKKIDASLESKSASDKQFAELAQRMEHAQQQLAARIERDAATRESAYARIDGLLRAPLAEKQFEQLAGRIDEARNALSEKIADGLHSRGGAEIAQLTELVGQLAQKVDAAMEPKADNHALLALAQQIDKLSRRLDRNEQSAASLISLEQSINQLFRRFDEKQGAASEASEAAARRAAQEVIREASTGLDKAFERGLADICKTQDESGRRVQESLSAVQNALERVIDRLAVFEGELTELRAPILGAAATNEIQTPPAPAAETPTVRSDARMSPRPAISALDDLLLESGGERPPPATEPPADFPLEAIPAPRSGSQARDHRGEVSVKADFIAAARRAAQQAAADAEAAQAEIERKAAARNRAAGDEPAGGFAGLREAFQARKRPVLLALGALVMLAGAYQVARLLDAAPTVTTARNENGSNSAKGGETPAKAPGLAAPAHVRAAPGADVLGPPVVKFVSPQDFAPMGPALSPAAPSSTPAAGQTPAAPSPSQPNGVDATPTGAIPKSGNASDSLGIIKELAVQGDGAAQFELASRYAEGRGVARDYKMAAHWFEKAAGQGLAPAEYRMGSIYEKGVGVERDYAKARDWYQRAAQHGNARAMHNLAVLFVEGGDGKPDYLSAAAWFRKAAELGVRDSQYNLGILCARGLGAAQSLTQSYLWFAVAAAQGDDDAAKKRDDVASRLDSKDLAAAKALVEGFRPLQPEKSSNEVSPPPGGWEAVKSPKSSGSSAVRPKLSAR